VNHRVPTTNNVTDAGPFNFNYFRAHIGEQAGSKRTGKHLLKADLDAVQRTHGFSIDRHLNLLPI
jgi:hypothetical protein